MALFNKLAILKFPFRGRGTGDEAEAPGGSQRDGYIFTIRLRWFQRFEQGPLATVHIAYDMGIIILILASLMSKYIRGPSPSPHLAAGCKSGWCSLRFLSDPVDLP